MTHMTKVLPVHQIQVGDHVAREFMVTEWGTAPDFSRATMVSAYCHRDHEGDTHVFIGDIEIVADQAGYRQVILTPGHRHRYLYMAVMLAIGAGIVKREWSADELDREWADLHGED